MLQQVLVPTQLGLNHIFTQCPRSSFRRLGATIYVNPCFQLPVPTSQVRKDLGEGHQQWGGTQRASLGTTP